MFSANRLPAKYVFRPKNGPVPSQPVNAYIINTQLSLYPSHILDLAVSSRPKFNLDLGGKPAKTGILGI